MFLIKKNTKLLTNCLLFSSLTTLKITGSFAATSPPHTDYYVQIGAYKSSVSAQKILSTVKKKYGITGRVLKEKINKAILYRVQMGPYSHLKLAKQAQLKTDKLMKSGFILSYRQVAHSPIPVNTPVVENRSPSLTNNTSFGQLTAHHHSPYHARIIGDGTASDKTNFFNGDIMLPLVGNNDWIGYIDGAGKYGEDHAWFGSAGAGIRSVVGNHLWGGYFFADRNVSRNDIAFLVANPGLELMTNRWDAHLNGYIPLGSKTKSLGIFRGNQIGIQNAFHFESHTLHEHLFNVMNTTGPGVDGEIGYTLPKLYNVRAFIGGYHFNLSKAPTVNGIEGGFEIPIHSNVSLLIHDAYDSVQRNTFMGTLRLTFGGLPKSSVPKIRDRMLDPLQRHLGTYQTGSGIPITRLTQQIDNTLATSNIWFFNVGGADFNVGDGFNNCTYEHPCGEFSQTALDGINNLAANGKLFVNSGIYENPLVGNGFSLSSGQSLHGRTNYFLQPASGTARPLLNDTLILTSNNTVENIQVNGNTISGTTLSGIRIDNNATGNIAITNSLVTANANNDAAHVVGLNSQKHSAALTVENSDFVVAITNSPTHASTGILINETVPFSMNGGSITTSSQGSNETAGLSGMLALININNVSINSSTNESGIIGLVAGNGSTVNLTNSTVSINANNGPSHDRTVAAAYFSGNALNIDHSSLNVNISNYIVNSKHSIDGINLLAEGALNMTNSQINVNATNSGGFIAGINNTGPGGINISQSLINVFSNNAGRDDGNFGIDSNGPIKLDKVEISVFATNSASVPIVGVQAFGAGSTYKDSKILASGNSPAVVQAVSTPSIDNLGNVLCITTFNGVTTVTPCP